MKRTLFFVSVIFLLLSGCAGNRVKKSPASSDTLVTVDSMYTKLFIRSCCGFTGGDGTYSVLLPDGRTLWIFGDTFFGKVNPDRSRTKTNPLFIRNSAVIQSGDSVRTLLHGTYDKPASWIIPPPLKGKNGSL